MLMLCQGIACSHVLSVKALPEPSLESSVYCTLFSYDGFRSQPLKKRPMGKVILFAVLTMDGCLADSSRKAQEWLAKTDTPDRFGIAAMKETARLLSEYTSLTMLVLDKSDTTCFIEANTTTASIINGMARMHLLDEIVLCTIPVIAGNGCRLFQGHLPESEWTRDGIKTYKDGSLKAVYRKSDGASVQKMNASRLKRLFRL